MPPVSRPPPPHVVRAAARLASSIAAEPPRPGTLLVGAPDPGILRALAVLAPVEVAADPERAGPPDGGYGVAVALDWLHRLDDPEAGLVRLRAIAPAHLLLGAPREPLAKLGIALRRGAAWSGPGFLRFASRHGAVRDVAHPLGWTLAWVRAA